MVRLHTRENFKRVCTPKALHSMSLKADAAYAETETKDRDIHEITANGRAPLRAAVLHGGQCEFIIDRQRRRDDQKTRS